MTLSDFIPPVLVRLFRKPAHTKVASAGTDAFATYDAAAKACGVYNDDEIARIVCEKTLFFKKNELKRLDNRQAVQNLLVLQYLRKKFDTIQVAEPGGACGALFFQAEAFLSGFIEKWVVMETPRMAEAGRSLANERLVFCHSLSEGSGHLTKKSICIASGVIQYTPDPLRYTMEILDAGFEYIYVTRQPLLTGNADTLITFQETNLYDHGPGSLSVSDKRVLKKTPVTYLPEEKFRALFNAKGYEPVFDFMESGPVPVMIGGKQYLVRTSGYLFKKK